VVAIVVVIASCSTKRTQHWRGFLRSTTWAESR